MVQKTKNLTNVNNLEIKLSEKVSKMSENKRRQQKQVIMNRSVS